MDSMSIAGRIADDSAKYAAGEIAKCMGFNAVFTLSGSAASCDGLLVDGDNVIRGIFEGKSRRARLGKNGGIVVRNEEYDTYLITEKKIADCLRLSMGLCVPFYLFVRLEDGAVLAWKIGDKKGKRLFNYGVQQSKTRKTINDPTPVVRSNAYLPIANAEIYYI